MRHDVGEEVMDEWEAVVAGNNMEWALVGRGGITVNTTKGKAS